MIHLCCITQYTAKVNDSSMLHNAVSNEKRRPLHMAISDGVGGTMASGTICLRDSVGHEAWLSNAQCVPAATTYLISVSAAIKDGCKLNSDSHSAQTLMPSHSPGLALSICINNCAIFNLAR